MKRLQITIEDDLYEALGRASAAEGISKAALVRRSVRLALNTPPRLVRDPLTWMIGADDFEPTSVDEIVYRSPDFGPR